MQMPSSIVACVTVLVSVMHTPAHADKSQAKDKLLSKLEAKVTLEFKRTPFQAAIQAIAKASNTKFTIDRDSMKAEGLTQNMPQFAKLENQTARKAVHEVVKKYPLVVCVDRKNQSFLVTSKSTAARDELEVVPLTDDDEKSRTASVEQLDRILRDAISKLNEDLESPQIFRRSRIGIGRHLALIQLVASVAPQSDSLTWRANADNIERLTAHMIEQSQKARQSYDDLKRGTKQLTGLIAGNAVGVDGAAGNLNEHMGLLMIRMEKAWRALKVVSNAPALSDEKLRGAQDQATVIALIASRIQKNSMYEGDGEWTAIARKLEESASSMTDLRSIKTGVALTGKSCTDCHQSFR